VKTKLLLDIDGVFGDFYSGFANYLNTKLGAGIDTSKEPHSYNMGEWGHNLPSKMVFGEVPKWINDGGYRNIPIYPGAKQFVYKLMDKYNVYIVTARIGDFQEENFSKATNELIRRDTVDWLIDNGIPADNLYFDHNKVDFCKDVGIDILIEDKLSTLAKASMAGLYGILIDRNWNHSEVSGGNHFDRNHSLIEVANDYNEALEKLEKLTT